MYKEFCLYADINVYFLLMSPLYMMMPWLGGDNCAVLTKIKIELHPCQGSFLGVFGTYNSITVGIYLQNLYPSWPGKKLKLC